MERYTKRLEDGQAVMDCANCSESWNTNPDGKCTALYCRNRLKDRLAAYEDTGLKPEEIKEQFNNLSPICIGCPGKKDGVRTELCGYDTGDMTRCLEQVKWLKRLAEEALRREQKADV